jgi:CHAD domain-containing protein
MAPAVPAARWLERLEESIPVARRGRDPEGVHRLRVAAGRLEVWLRLHGLHVLRDDLGWLRSCAGPVRDHDVILHARPPASWVPWLKRRRTEARRALLAALDEPRLPALVRALGLLPPLDRAQAEERSERLLAKALAAAAHVEEDPHDAGRLHELRRRVRRLRYAREWLEQEVGSLERLQEALGQANDAAVALRLLGGYRDAEGLAEYRSLLEGRFCVARERALRAWQEQRALVSAPA